MKPSEMYARGKQKLVEDAAPSLLKALERIVTAWESVPEDAQVPEEINVNELWDQARDAINQAYGRG